MLEIFKKCIDSVCVEVNDNLFKQTERQVTRNDLFTPLTFFNEFM